MGIRFGKKLSFALLCFTAVSAALASSQASATITMTEGANTVTTPNFEWNFTDGAGNIERVEGLKWSRESGGTLSANLAASGGAAGCGGPSEFWGQSYGNADGQGPGPVVAGGAGSWIPHGGRTVELNSTAPTNCSGDEPAIPVRTRYTFFDSGAAANMVRIERTWSFSPTQEPYAVQGMRAYVPRLSYGTYDQEIHPDSTGTKLAPTEGICNVCITKEWDQSWLAINASSTNSGILLLRDPANTSPASITDDYDSSSGSNNSGITLDRPTPNGWTAPLTETEYMCFYDVTSWPTAERSPTRLPDGCAATPVPINTAAPVISAGAGDPQPGEGFSATPGSWQGATGSFTYRWSRCAGDSCEAISGATGLGYTATAADVGRSLQITETATAPGGQTDSASSNIAGTVSGKVFSGSESPANQLSGAPVQACRVGGGSCRSGTTDGEGLYRIQVPVSGDYEITAFPPAASNALPRTRASASTIVDEAETANQNVVLAIPQPPPPSVGIGGAGYRGSTGSGTPVVHWQEPFVIEYRADIESKVEVVIRFPTEEKTFPPEEPAQPDPKTPGGGIFKFPIPPLYPNHGPVDVTIKVKPPGKPDEEIVFPMYIDPSGFVRTTDGAPIAGATVTLFRSESKAGPFAVVPDGSAVMSPMNRKNQDVTDAGGHFGWDVIAGYYKVRAEKSGCHAPGNAGQVFAETGVQTIPPPVTNLDVRLECAAALRPAERLRPGFSLPRHLKKITVQKSGAFKVRSATVSCPAASQLPCGVSVGVSGSAPPKKKSRISRAALKLGTSKLSIAPGKTALIQGKLSAKGLGMLRKLGSVKARIAIAATVPGGETDTRSLSATLVPIARRKP